MGDNIQESLTGNLHPGTDADGNECTIDSQTWSWTCTTTYSSDNTNYGPSPIQATITGGQNAVLFATFTSSGYYRVQWQGHVDFQTNCISGSQHLDTPPYAQYFSVDGRDFDFTVPDGNTTFAVNQGESGTFISNLTSINNFIGQVSFGNSDSADKLYGVSGSGNLLSPGTAPVTISVGQSAKVGDKHLVGIRGSGSAGSTPLYHDKGLTVTVLKRGVNLVRDGAHDETINLDGSKSGDTTYSYTAYNGPAALPDLNTQTFHPTLFSGIWTLEASHDYNGTSGNFPSVTYVWSPYETQDVWDQGLWKVSYGTIDQVYNPATYTFELSGKPTGVKTQIITYTATDKGTEKSASASYVLRCHDQIENMNDVVFAVEAGPAPLFGSDGTSDGLYKVPGLFDPHKDTAVNISQGSENSHGYTIDIGVDIPFTAWAKQFGFSPGVSADFEHTDTKGPSVPCNVLVPLGFVTYPEYINTYNRHTYTWREFDKGGEIILHNPDNSVKPHSHMEDIYVAVTIVWAAPIRNTVLLPQYSPTPIYTPH